MILVFSKCNKKSALFFLISTSKIHLAKVPSLNSNPPCMSWCLCALAAWGFKRPLLEILVRAALAVPINFDYNPIRRKYSALYNWKRRAVVHRRFKTLWAAIDRSILVLRDTWFYSRQTHSIRHNCSAESFPIRRQNCWYPRGED
jgi:hypothetical protein